MLAITSLSPTHINADIQQKAINSWRMLGFEVVSMNGYGEEIKEDAKIIRTHRTMNGILRKPLVSINAMLDYGKDSDHEIVMLINSDILLVDTSHVFPKYLELAKEGIVCGKRRDFDEDINSNRLFESGFDFFIIHKNFLNIFHQSIYCMGATHWDWWIPYTATKKNIPIYLIKEPVAFHKTHPNQWDSAEWHKLAEYFRWEYNLTMGKNIQMVNQSIFTHINSHFQ